MEIGELWILVRGWSVSAQLVLAIYAVVWLWLLAVIAVSLAQEWRRRRLGRGLVAKKPACPWRLCVDDAAAVLSGLEFCPRCGSGPRQRDDVIECPDCGYLWAGPRLLDVVTESRSA